MENRPRLLWVGNRRIVGGISVLTERFLADPEVHRRFQVKVQDPSWGGGWDEVYALRFVKIPRGLLSTVWNMLTFRPQIVHIQTAYKQGFLRDGLEALIARRLGAKVVMTFHSGFGRSMQAIYHEGPRWLKALTRRVIPQLDAVVANGPSYRDFFASEFGHKNIWILQNPVPDEEVPPPADDYAQREKVVFFAGSLDHRKGVFELIRAAASVPDARFIIFGKSATSEDAAELTEALGSCSAGDRILLDIGWGTQKVFSYMQRARLLALPSWGESLPQILEEAMVCGVPVVTTPVGVIPDYVQDGVHGYLIEPGDVNGLAAAINKILDNQGEAIAMCQRNRIAGRQFLRSQVHPRLFAMYDQLAPAR